MWIFFKLRQYGKFGEFFKGGDCATLQFIGNADSSWLCLSDASHRTYCSLHGSRPYYTNFFINLSYFLKGSGSFVLQRGIPSRAAGSFYLYTDNWQFGRISFIIFLLMLALTWLVRFRRVVMVLKVY